MHLYILNFTVLAALLLKENVGLEKLHLARIELPKSDKLTILIQNFPKINLVSHPFCVCFYISVFLCCVKSTFVAFVDRLVRRRRFFRYFSRLRLAMKFTLRD